MSARISIINEPDSDPERIVAITLRETPAPTTTGAPAIAIILDRGAVEMVEDGWDGVDGFLAELLPGDRLEATIGEASVVTIKELGKDRQ